jgi:hypothetical protein
LRKRIAASLAATLLLLHSSGPAGHAQSQTRPPARSPEKPIAAPPKPDQSLILNVLATEPWTDTGLTVHAGDRLEIRAWGSVRVGDVERAVPPAGRPGRGTECSFVVTDSRVPADSLVANVAPRMTFDGRGFLIGPKWSGAVPIAGSTAPEGRLFLGVNHDAVMCDRSGYDSWKFRINNSGAFTVEISIRRRR